ncbi:hypothetical protein UlMin_019280 [Ulmus minor]
MADFVISPLAEHLVSHALEKIEEEVKLVKNVKQDVEKLEATLFSIQALLEDAERKQIDSKIIKLWLSKMEETSFRVDNVLDGWNSDILKAQIEKEQGEDDESVADPNKKVCLPVLSSCFRFKPVLKQVLDHREIAKKVQDLNKELDAILEETTKLGIVATAVGQSQQQKASLPLLKPKLTTSLVNEKETHGRDEVKETLIGKLLCESSHGENVELISIVGTGGLGKTTLAQLAFNDERIEISFNKRIWVCVSEPFEQVKIAKVIIEGLGENAQSDTTLDALLRRIRDMVKEQKFLLVLDDVWTKEHEDWRQLEHALRHGGAGSRILVTTRNQEVAIMMKAETRMIPLDLLSDECCWLIIKQLAVEGRGRDQAKVAELEEIGREIARKCKGLPLYATTLGSLLCFKETKSEWKGILDDKLWQSQKDFAPFLLSYYDLSLSERCCLSYCSIFPKDYMIERDRLIGMWMSQGYFSSGREGKEHFKSLCMRSLFQDIHKSEYGKVYCKMHDIVHDFVQYLTKGKFSVINVDDVEGEMELLENVRHLTIIREIYFSGFSVLKFNEKNRENMRSLIVKSSGGDEFLFSDRPASYQKFPNCSHLRTLGLANICCEKLPESITAMRHLRYLDLSDNTELRELPESLCDLCNLQTLKLDGCYRLERLPKDIAKLVNLRNLYIRGCGLEGLPKGIRKLRSLEKLDWFVIPSKEKREEYFDVGDFNELKCLQYQESLEITGAGNLENTDEAKKINLENMEDLVYLDLNFGFGNDNSNQITILEALKPHPYLETLTIGGHPTCSPKWLTSLAHLKCLELRRGVYCEILPPLGKLLPSLESLTIAVWKSVKKVGHELLGIEEGKRKDPSQSSFVSFPKLKQLSFYAMFEWKEWEGSIPEDGSLQVMPSLRSLAIQYCEKLEGLPDFLRMIRLPTLYIQNCEILKQGCQKGTGKEWLKISHIPNIQIDGKYVQRDGVWVQEDDVISRYLSFPVVSIDCLLHCNFSFKIFNYICIIANLTLTPLSPHKHPKMLVLHFPKFNFFSSAV